MARNSEEGSVQRRKAEEGKAKLCTDVNVNFFIPQRRFNETLNTRAPIAIKMI